MDDGQELNYIYQNVTRDSVQKLVANLAHTLAHTLYCLINSTGPCDEPKVPETDTDSQLVSLCGSKIQYWVGFIIVFLASCSLVEVRCLVIDSFLVCSHMS